jgi:glycosyltransferase involved in cell wall biosynthesis
MRVAIDATAIPRQMAGAGVYTDSLIRAIHQVDRENEYVVFARRDSFADLRRPGFSIVAAPTPNRPARLLWEQSLLPLQLRRRGVDVLHSPHHTTPLAAARCRQVVTFHDLTFFLLPARYPLGRALYFQAVSRASARRADALIVPSDAVRADVARILAVPESRITTVHEAPAPVFRPIGDGAELGRVREKYGLPDRFILSVGSLEPGKNRGRLVKAFQRLRARGLEQRLVIVGGKAWKYEEDFELVERLGLGDDVLFTGYVPADELAPLYNCADLFAFPSLYEGFGLPVLEAMACGVPVVTSNVSAMPEVAGNAALLVNPYDIDELAEAMRRALRQSRTRTSLRSRGLKRAGQFSLERAACETVTVYERAAAEAAEAV